MATSKSQRIGIWIIAGALTIGTLAGFIAMILAPQNEAADSARLNEIYAKYQKELATYEKSTSAQQKSLDNDTKALSKKYYSQLASIQASTVAQYDASAAHKKLLTSDVKKGSGEVITKDSTYAAYYIGWLPSGKVFDGSIDKKSLKTPLIVRPGGVIQGWSEGVKGMKIGAVRVLTIPAEQAYGENGQGEIPANSPLKFIVFPVKSLKTYTQPEFPEELLQYGG